MREKVKTSHPTVTESFQLCFGEDQAVLLQHNRHCTGWTGLSIHWIRAVQRGILPSKIFVWTYEK